MYTQESFEAIAAKASSRGAALSPSIVCGVFGILDLILVFVAGIGAGWVAAGGQLPQTSDLYLTVGAVSVLTIGAFYFGGLYEFDSIVRPTQKFSRIFFVAIAVPLIVFGTAYVLDVLDQLSRRWAALWWLCTLGLTMLARTWGYLLLRKQALHGRLARNIVVVGSGVQAKTLLKQLDSEREPWNRVLCVFDDRAKRVGTNVLGFPILGNINDLIAFARKYRVDDIVIALPWHADERLHYLFDKLKVLPVHIRLSSDLVGFKYLGQQVNQLGGIPMVDIVDKPISGWKVVVKWFEDKILGALFLALLSPIMLIIAIAIKLESPGPVIFRQKRYGFNNQVFTVYKFRTMFVRQEQESGVPQATRDDPRVTRVGKLLRRTSLDEIPQFLNVIQGTMSVVGPRPHAVEHNEQYSKIVGGYFSRHRVKPGVTGWAQVNGLRGETVDVKMMEERVKYDVEYIDNWSLLFDLQIIVMTALVVFLQKNAY